jgi:hypothetical protein
LTVTDSSFVGNSANGYYGCGGGLYNGAEYLRVLTPGQWWQWQQISNNCTTDIRNSHFINNQAAFGGGLYWYGRDSDVNITDCVISDNIAEHGGGMYWSGGEPNIIGCLVTGNTAHGTFISSFYGPQYGQDFYGGGGGMLSWASEALIQDCYVTDNSASGTGGGIYLVGGASEATMLTN